jgi:hypothetical protein
MNLIISIQPQQRQLSTAIVGVAGIVIGALITLFGTYIMEKRRINKEDHEKRRQVYTLLNGQKDELFQLYASLIQAKFESERIESVMKYYRPDDFYMLQSTRDNLIQQHQLSDRLIVDIAEREGDLTETLSSIQYSFNKGLMNKKIKNILNLIKANRNFVEDMRISLKQQLNGKISELAQIDRQLDSKSETLTDSSFIQIIRTIDGDELNNLTRDIEDYFIEETINYIIMNIMESVVDLLLDMENSM